VVYVKSTGAGRVRDRHPVQAGLRRRLEEWLADLPDEEALERAEVLRAKGHAREADLLLRLRAKETGRRAERAAELAVEPAEDDTS
jgi:Lon protease-like protein